MTFDCLRVNKLNALETQRNPPESRLRGQVPFTYTYRRQRGHTCSARFAFILILISQLRVGSCQLTRALNGRTELNLLDPRAVQAPTAKRQPPHCPYDNGRQRLEGPIVSVTVGISQAPSSDASCRGVPLTFPAPPSEPSCLRAVVVVDVVVGAVEPMATHLRPYRSTTSIGSLRTPPLSARTQ